ncbi:Protein qutG [Vanrija pseudolonga]|uniref:Inositol-1-monophosphatase n=1 Tax=Vanrija pseudolonga TaxID=143232 RepID=A0AAF0YDU3_9TREE|nr:Protein qutG [Vanrija pseudolonga]
MVKENADSRVDIDEVLAFAIQLARDAGDLIREGQAGIFKSQSVAQTKANAVDLVTEVDKAVEAFIFGRIRAAYPQHQFIGEETYHGQVISDKPTWIAWSSPIDGTTNFIHGYPMAATSIGLAVGGVPVVGVVYNPFLNMLYSAGAGRGAYLNQTTRLPITGKPRPLADLGHALISVDIGGSRRPSVLSSRLRTFEKLAGEPEFGGKMVHSLRSIGCASLNICQVASGGQDMHWEIGAGICILTEAGGAAFGGKHTALTGEVDRKLIVGRKYLFVRNIAPGPGETGLEVQRQFATQFYDLTDDIEP